MVQFLSIIFFLVDFFNFCWVFQKFPFFYVTLYKPVWKKHFEDQFIDATRTVRFLYSIIV